MAAPAAVATTESVKEIKITADGGNDGAEDEASPITPGPFLAETADFMKFFEESVATEPVVHRLWIRETYEHQAGTAAVQMDVAGLCRDGLIKVSLRLFKEMGPDAALRYLRQRCGDVCVDNVIMPEWEQHQWKDDADLQRQVLRHIFPEVKEAEHPQLLKMAEPAAIAAATERFLDLECVRVPSTAFVNKIYDAVDSAEGTPERFHVRFLNITDKFVPLGWLGFVFPATVHAIARRLIGTRTDEELADACFFFMLRGHEMDGGARDYSLVMWLGRLADREVRHRCRCFSQPFPCR